MIARARRLFPMALLAFLAAAVPVRGDTWGPRTELRTPDANGRFYVTITEGAYGRALYTFAERGAGTAPVEARAGDGRWGIPKGCLPRLPRPTGDRLVRPGDRVLASGHLPQWPVRVLVSSRGRGFVALEVHGGILTRDTVVIVSREGDLRARVPLEALYSGNQRDRFRRSVTIVFWLRDAWIDEEAGDVVLVATDDSLRVVDFETGEVRHGGGREIDRALLHPEARVRERGLELVIAWRRREAADAVAKLFERPGEPLAVRLRAAAALAVAADDRRGVNLVTATAAAETADVESDDRAYALRSLPSLLGKDALPLLLRAGPEVPSVVPAALADLGDAAVGPLIEEVRKRPSRWAIEALGRLGSRRALPALLRVVGDRSDGSLASAAMDAAVAIAGAEIAPDLRALRNRGTAIDDEIDDRLAGLR